MSGSGMSLDEAELLSTILEGILYGFSLLMFLQTLWTLKRSRRSTRTVIRRSMVAVSCLLLLLSTAHIVINIIRVMEGLILFRDTYPGGPIAFFSDVPQWTFLAANYLFIIQSWVGGAFLLFRCYAVWQAKLIMLLPAFLWCASFATGIACMYTAMRAGDAGIFEGVYAKWVASFWAATLATNLLTALLLVYRIWYIDWKATRSLDGQPKSLLRLAFRIVIDAGLIYSVTLFVVMVCFLCESNGQYVVLGMITPIISITVYMIMIRIGMVGRQQLNDLPLSFAPPDFSISRSGDEVRVTRIRIPTLTECEAVEHGEHSLVLSSPSTFDHKKRTSDCDKEGV